MLKDAQIQYTNDDIQHIVELSDGHPFNVRFLIEAATERTLPVVLADTTEFTQWKRNRGAEFLRQIQFSDTEKSIISALKDFTVLDFETLHKLSSTDIPDVGRTIARLMDFHIIEGSGDAYQVSPPLRIAVGRDAQFMLAPDRRKATMLVVSETLKTRSETSEISTSLIDAGILASLQAGEEIPSLFAVFLLPSHYVWLARRQYDERRWDECIKLTLKAMEGIKNLSPAGRVEVCRLLCLSAARSDKREEFEKGLRQLRGLGGDAWARSNVSFLLGFQARLEGRVPDAETNFREAYREVPSNFHAARELAAISLMRGDLDTAEIFARKSLQVAPDNPYLLDILLGVLISGSRGKPRGQHPEIEFLFGRLEQAAQTDDRSFYATRRAEYEATHGSLTEACRLIDDAARKTPGIFAVHALRAKIYLDRGIKGVAWEEIEKMRRVVYRAASGERRSNLRPLLETEAAYAASNGDYEHAKNLFRTKGIFTDDEAERAIKDIEYEQAMVRR